MRVIMEVNLFADVFVERPLINHATMPIKKKCELYDSRVLLEDTQTIEARYWLPKGYTIKAGRVVKKNLPVLKIK